MHVRVVENAQEHDGAGGLAVNQDRKDGHLTQKTEKVKDRNGKMVDKTVYSLTDKGEKGLRGGYATWLEETGQPHFGNVLDHGDVAGALGDVEAEQPASGSETAEEPPKALTDAKAKALKLAEGYKAPEPIEIKPAGAGGRAAVPMGPAARGRLLPPGTRVGRARRARGGAGGDG